MCGSDKRCQRHQILVASHSYGWYNIMLHPSMPLGMRYRFTLPTLNLVEPIFYFLPFLPFLREIKQQKTSKSFLKPIHENTFFGGKYVFFVGFFEAQLPFRPPINTKVTDVLTYFYAAKSKKILNEFFEECK